MCQMTKRLKVHEAETDVAERRNGQIHNCSWLLQYLTFSKQKINKDLEEPNIIDQQYLMGIYRTFCLMIAEYILKYPWNIDHNRPWVTKYKHMNKSKRTEIIWSIFSDHNRMKLDIDSRKLPNTWKENNALLDNAWIKEKISKKNVKLHKTEWKYQSF